MVEACNREIAMPERNWERERDKLLDAVERATRNYDGFFEEMRSKMLTGTFGQDPGDQGLAHAVEALDAKLREARDALYRHTQAHLRSLSL